MLSRLPWSGRGFHRGSSKPARFPALPHGAGPLLCCTAVCLFLAFSASITRADEWKGTTEVKDGVAYVHSPAEPMRAPETVQLRELWRIGGDSTAEEEFFGVIERITADPEGNVYLLDRQLSEVKVFSPDGKYLRTIGREGEGPGEFRQPMDLFFLPDGNLGVLQLVPGRIVMLTPEGDPVGDHPLPELEGGDTAALVRGQRMGDDIVLVLSHNEQHEDRIDIHRLLVRVGSDGKIETTLLESTRPLRFVDFLFDETVWRTFDNRWSVSPEGRVFAVPEFQDYKILVWDPQGNRRQVITRDFESRKRSPDQKKRMDQVFHLLLQNQLPNFTVKVSDFDPDITNLYARPDGTLWVLTSRGSRDQPEGAVGVFDVFDAEGRYQRQVTLMGEGDPQADGYFFLGNRFFVVTDLLESEIASRGGRLDEEEDQDSEPMAVICYELEEGELVGK